MGDPQTSLFEQVGEVAVTASTKEAAARRIAEVIRTSRAYRWVGVYEVGDAEIYALAWDGPNDPAYPRFPKTEGLCGQAVRSRQAVLIDDVTKNAHYLTTLGSTRSELVVPVLTTAGHVVGLIDVESERVGAFTAEDVSALQECASAIRPLWAS